MTMRRSRMVAITPDIMISEKTVRAANLPQVANSVSGMMKMLPTRRTSKTVRLQSVDQKLAARRRSMMRRPNAGSLFVIISILLLDLF
jgi:hypothetical protein